MKIKSLLTNKVFIAVAVVAIGASGYIFWSKAHKPSMAERYKTQQAEMGDVAKTVAANGALNPVVLVSVGTQVSGTVLKLNADFNDKVKKGQVLVELDPSIYKAQVNQSRANVSNAEAGLELATTNEARMRDIYKHGYATKQELDQAVQVLKSARAQLALAHAQLEKDLINLAYTVIKSPVSGVVVDRQIDVGQTVAASFQTPTLFKIAQDLKKMQIDSSFAEADIGSITVGQVVRFSVDAFPNRFFKGIVKLVRLNPTTQQNVVTYDVVVDVNNQDQALLPGMTAYVGITVAQRKNVLLVPNAALRFKPPETARKSARPKGKNEKRDAASGTVYLVAGDQLRPISIGIGITDNKYTEVVSGDLKAGDSVVVEEISAAAPRPGQPPSSVRMRVF